MDSFHNEAIISIFPYYDYNYSIRNYLFKILPLLSNYGDIKDAIKGKTLNSTSLNNLLIPLAPLNEENRIVNKIEKILPIIDDYNTKYTKLEELNNNYKEELKKSILQYAIQGKLVKQDPNDEPASILINKILDEKRNLMKSKKIKKENLSIIYKDTDNQFYEKFDDSTINNITDEIPFDIPDNWCWTRLRNIGIYKKGPFGSALTKSIFVPKSNNTIKVYEQKNAIQKSYLLGDYYITREYFESKMKGFEIFPGDIIVSCAGTIGESYIMPKKMERGIINQALMRMKISDYFPKKYFLVYFDYVLKKSSTKKSSGSAIKNIPPFEIFKEFLVAVPPVKEQYKIIEKLDLLNNIIKTAE
jgi:type I restriction enzyme S subunit